jgi:hypothetical protein
MKMKPQIIMALSAVLIAGVLLAGLFCAQAQGEAGARGGQDEEVEAALIEDLEEEFLAEALVDFPGQIVVSEYDVPPAGRLFDPRIILTADSSAVRLRDWITPLRI